MKLYGLIGFPLEHSFSQTFFSEKFEKEQIKDIQYLNFPLDTLDKFPKLWQKYPNLLGLNVTIPYKQKILPFLDKIDSKAIKINAINVIKKEECYLKGFNTDYIGFKKSLLNFLTGAFPKALILGTGGASKAVEVALQDLNIDYALVSRTKNTLSTLTYNELKSDHFAYYKLIINTTPLGMYPKTSNLPTLPYQAIDEMHFLYDLVYNPSITTFLREGIRRKAKIKNGLEMLYRQAEEAWRIWNGHII